jgi:hypothetical protein
VRAGESRESGEKPTFVGSPRNAEIKSALGRFFAHPAPDGAFFIDELYHFDRGDPRGTLGKPFPCRLHVGADGTVRVVRLKFQPGEGEEQLDGYRLFGTDWGKASCRNHFSNSASIN